MYNNSKIWKIEHKKLLCNSISYCKSFLIENNELTYCLLTYFPKTLYYGKSNKLNELILCLRLKSTCQSKIRSCWCHLHPNKKSKRKKCNARWKGLPLILLKKKKKNFLSNAYSFSHLRVDLVADQCANNSQGLR